MMSDGREVGRGRAFVSLVIHASFFDIPAVSTRRVWRKSSLWSQCEV
jgi:hypothetical protein